MTPSNSFGSSLRMRRSNSARFGGIERLDRLLPRRPLRRALGADLPPRAKDVVRHDKRLEGPVQRLPRAGDLGSAGASPCALFVPARVGRPKPIVVLQAIMVGLSEFWRRGGVEDRGRVVPIDTAGVPPGGPNRAT